MARWTLGRQKRADGEHGGSRAHGRALAALIEDPVAPDRHAALGEAYLEEGRPILAAACLRSALALGAPVELKQRVASALLHAGYEDLAGEIDMSPAEFESLAREARDAGAPPTTDLLAMNHNRYYRVRTLSEHLLERFGPRFSVLDLGGGQGELALFLPEAEYILAEPTRNGISCPGLPFAEGRFDAVVSCHVLEHVPPDARESFLDELVSLCASSLVLLGPFHVEGAREVERLEALLELTDAPWIREHLECGLPLLGDLEDYASRRGLGFEAQANGSSATTFAMVAAEHLAVSSGRSADLEPVRRFLNTAPIQSLVHDEIPTAYLVELSKPKN